MNEPNTPHLHNRAQVVLSQPAKAVTAVQPAPRPAAKQLSAVQKKGKPRKHKEISRRHMGFWRLAGLLLLTVLVSLTSVQLFLFLTGGADNSAAIARVYKKNLSSVVLITSEFPGEPVDGAVSGGTGTGVIYSSDGGIITNAHVVQNADRITVTLHSGAEYSAQVVGLDENTDLAALKIEATGLHAADFASSAQIWRLSVGDTAIVIGNPLGAELADTLTCGVISATRRGVEVGSSIVEMLQTDASVSPGNSGGPMFDLKGDVIGIISSKVVEEGAEGLGFAIPADLAKRVIDELFAYGSVVSRPMLGITVQSMDQETADYYYDTYGEVYEAGMIVIEVTPGSCADKAGVQQGDKILAFDGYDIATVNQLNYLKESHRAGDTVIMKVEREGQTLELSLKLELSK